MPPPPLVPPLLSTCLPPSLPIPPSPCPPRLPLLGTMPPTTQDRRSPTRPCDTPPLSAAAGHGHTRRRRPVHEAANARLLIANTEQFSCARPATAPISRQANACLPTLPICDCLSESEAPLLHFPLRNQPGAPLDASWRRVARAFARHRRCTFFSSRVFNHSPLITCLAR
jgi:hypothetical protein